MVDITQFIGEEATLPTYTFLGDGSMVTDLLLLQHLAMRTEVQNYFEIGTWRGESLLAVLPHIIHAGSLDLAEEDIDKLGFTANWKAQIGTLTGKQEKVTFFRSDSKVFDFTSVDSPYDLIYIDGTHSYAYVKQDTIAVLRHLVHEQSIVVWHDYAHDPENIRWEVYAAILDAVPASAHQQLYHVSHTKCALLIRDEALAAQGALFPQEVNGTWEVTLRHKRR